MLDRGEIDFIEVPSAAPPSLFVVIDTEEEFDWALPHARANTSVGSIAAQHRAQEIFERYGVVPIYVVDYPVAANEAAAEVLRGLYEAGRCEIGAHLHPWVNPPHEEEVNARNSYPGNLPAALERAKLEALTRQIETAFGVRPTVYRAGRYGVGPATSRILEELGYKVDLSVVPRSSFTGDGGPDFQGWSFPPYRFGRRRDLLEIPLSCGFYGRLRSWGPVLYPALTKPLGMKLHAPGFAARLGLLERIRLTPEGIDHAAHRRLTKSLLAQGCRVFSLNYHSPSLEPGHTPYVRDETELRAFLETIERYLDYFMNELGGRPTTPMALYRSLVPEQIAELPLAEAALGQGSAE